MPFLVNLILLKFKVSCFTFSLKVTLIFVSSLMLKLLSVGFRLVILGGVLSTIDSLFHFGHCICSFVILFQTQMCLYLGF